ncbi:hypothetical protein [Streptomyces sp. MBT33]|nr:hypothetical protein [Streptomyces sp. MBT33]MBK3640965.1 hypothetical protein [Streptomyces sp. MBT33]
MRTAPTGPSLRRRSADGHPLRITLDQDENTIDDEALYVVTAYEPTPR